MNYFELILISVSLAMDCFAVSISTGCTQKQLPFRNTLLLAFCFGFFQAGMPLIGWFGGSFVVEYMSHIDHWIAFGILAFIGGKMLLDGIRGDSSASSDVTKVGTIFILSIATSIDALAVGFGFSLLQNVRIWLAVSFIGVASLLLSLGGFYLGKYLGRYIKPRYAQLLGGAVLLSIGVKILIEHLFA